MLENMVVDSIYNTYGIDYQNIGYDSSGNVLNRLRVVAVLGIKDIIIMYSSTKEAIRFKSYLDDGKKAITCIDKFNARLAKMKK